MSQEFQKLIATRYIFVALSSLLGGALLLFVFSVWGPSSILSLVVLLILPGTIITLVARKPSKPYWIFASISATAGTFLGSIIASFSNGDTTLHEILAIIIWTVTAFLLFVGVTLFRSVPQGNIRDLSAWQTISTAIFIWLLTIFIVSFVSILQLGAPFSPLECQDYRLQLSYNQKTQKFTGKQNIKLDFKWSDDHDLARDRSTNLLPLQEQTAISQMLDQEGFREWSRNGLRIIDQPAEGANLYKLEIDLSSNQVMSRAISSYLLATTTEFFLPIGWRGCRTTDIKVYAPRYVILQHNLRAEQQDTILDDGKDGIAILGNMMLGDTLRIKHAHIFLQNPVLASIAGVTWWQLPVWLLTLTLGVIGYLGVITADILREETVKPFAARVLTKIGLFRPRKNGKAKQKGLMQKGESPLKILFLAANPSDSTRLRLDEEVRAIDQALHQSEFRDKFDLEQHWAVRITDLQLLLLRYRPSIVHFSGHGSESGEIILEDSAGNSAPVSVEAIGQLFAILKGELRCVILNACFSKVQAEAIARNIDCVVGITEAIEDKAAISFATAFYQALGFGKDIKTAFDLGCLQIDLENSGDERKLQLLSFIGDSSEIRFI